VDASAREGAHFIRPKNRAGERLDRAEPRVMMKPRTDLDRRFGFSRTDVGHVLPPKFRGDQIDALVVVLSRRARSEFRS
jgi:hypothetical protein